MQMTSVKKATITALCVALCAVLPLVFHLVGLGAAFSPLHLPVLLCGLVCGWPYGLFCGIAGPVISSLTSGMPAALQLVHMIPELAAYGFFAGLFYRLIHTGNALADLLLSLLPAMVLGRVIGGAAQAVFYLSTAREYSLALWATGYVVGTLPGVAAQLVVLPLLVTVLTQAKLIPPRYAGGEKKGGAA